MMRISAVICELNPAHEGHKYIFDRARECGDVVVAVMSGNFVQRGENAIFDKYKRAESALEIGADVVLELPFPWSCASAQYFAVAAVHIAESVGCTDLVFGSESGNIDALKKAALLLSGELFNSAIPGDERAAEYRERLLYELDPSLPEGILSRANDILGVEYIKNLKNAEAHPIRRISCHSASSIRAEIKDNRSQFGDAVFYDRLTELIFNRLRCDSKPDFATAEAAGGVGMRLYKAAFDSKNGEEMIAASATKQYTNARLKRCGLYYLTDVKRTDLQAMPLFSTVLGFNKKGREYLSSIRKRCSLELITKPASVKWLAADVKTQADKNSFADSIYALISNKSADCFIKCGPVIKI